MMLWQLLSRLPRQQWDPIVVSLRAEGGMRPRFERSGIRVLSPDMNPARPNPLAWWRLTRILQDLQPEILQGWMYHANVAAAWCSKYTPSARLYFSIHNSIYNLQDEKLLTAWIIKRGAALSSRTEKVIYCAESTAAQHEAIGYAKRRSIVIHNGFDTDSFKPNTEAKRLLRSELQIGSDAVMLGLIARFDAHKDHENFFAAARLIADNIPRARFVLAGKGIDSSNAILSHLITRHALQEHVCLLGERSDVPRIMAGLDVLLSSSSSEALPSVVGEAMACEVPCAVTDVGDSKLLVGSFGQVSPARDPKALAAGALKICALPGEQRKTLGEACRAHIVRNFSISTMVHSYSGLYAAETEHGKVA